MYAQIRYEILFVIVGIRKVFTGDRVSERIREIIEKGREQGNAVGDVRGFEKSVEILISLGQAMADAKGNLNPDDSNYALQMNEVYDEVLKEKVNLSFAFVRDRLRPLPLFKRLNRVDPDRKIGTLNDQDDIMLIGEFLYLKHIYPKSTNDELVEILSEALNDIDDEMWERLSSYPVMVLGQLLY